MQTKVHHFTSLRQKLYISELGYMGWTGKHRVKPYMRNVYILHFVTKGKMRYCGQEIQAGQGFLVAKQTVHSMDFDGQSHELFWFAFDGESAETLLKEIGLSPTTHGTFNINNLPYVETLLRMALKVCDKDKNEDVALSAFLGCLPFLAVRHGETPVERGYFEAAVGLMKRNHYRHLSMNDIAREINVSEKHLCKLFKARCGQSPKQYLTGIRMEAAKKMLLESNLAVKEIAEIEGYSSQGAFSQAFTNYFGVRPTAMKKK